MKEDINDLLVAVASEDALETENIFNKILADKISEKIDQIAEEMEFDLEDSEESEEESEESESEEELDEEELDELSKATLGSYIKKATGDAISKSVQGVHAQRNGGDDLVHSIHTSDRDESKKLMKRSQEHQKTSERYKDKAYNRVSGIIKATNKLTKENADLMGLELDEEELDELSKKTLGSYIKKNAAHRDRIASKDKELEIAGQAANSAAHMSNNYVANAALQLGDEISKTRARLSHKKYNRQDGMNRAIKKLTKENAELMGLDLTEEELDELSKATLGSYVNKAASSIGNLTSKQISSERKGERAANKADRSDDVDDIEKYSKKSFDHRVDAYNAGNKTKLRKIGISTAIKKLTKENAELMGLDLTEEELDEISFKTLNSYIHKIEPKRKKNAEKFYSHANKVEKMVPKIKALRRKGDHTSADMLSKKHDYHKKERDIANSEYQKIDNNIHRAIKLSNNHREKGTAYGDFFNKVKKENTES